MTSDDAERVKHLRQACKWAERARERKYDPSETNTQQDLVEESHTARRLAAWNIADNSHAVSSRLEDFSAQRTALMMKAALAGELGDDAGVKEAEDLEVQLVRENEEMLNAR